MKFSRLLHIVEATDPITPEKLLAKQERDKQERGEECDPDRYQDLLFISGNNTKLGHPSMSLAAGYSCPHAKECLAKYDAKKGVIIRGKDMEHQCYAAGTESYAKGYRENVHKNLDLLKKIKNDSQAMADLIVASIDESGYADLNPFRIHVGGDFFNDAYFDAWIKVAKARPKTLFYTYTKSIKKLASVTLPKNLIITASFGGTQDHLIKKNNLKYAIVVNSPEEAEELGLKLDYDDTLAWGYPDSFALWIHGGQEKGTEAQKAWTKAKSLGKEGRVKVMKAHNKTIDAKRASVERLM